SIWFMRRAPPISALLHSVSRGVAPVERGAALRHGGSHGQDERGADVRLAPLAEGDPSAMTSEEAIAVAATARGHASTTVADGQPFAAGVEVTVAASDYAHDEIGGSVVALADAD